MNTHLFDQIRQEIDAALAAGSDPHELHSQILGRKGKLADFYAALKQASPEERRTLGQAANAFRAELTARFEGLLQTPEAASSTVFDPTLPALPVQLGSLHPISRMIEEMVGIFRDLSFEVVDGDEIVSDLDNFENLNITTDHPARDSHDSFYLTENLLLRTQTTAVQVMEMRRRLKNNELPIRVVVPGKTYRRESDQTHSAMFHQIDAVMVDMQTTFADLKGSIDYFARRLFGEQIETRFRPHYFPFTEPSAELDVKLKNATGTGKHTGWLEIGGCGMIHPEVLKRAGLNPKVYRGWAFGMSIERPIMLRYQVPDLRLLFANHPDFLSQLN